jgi:peptide-methionine (S)-S-oxide reductase
MTYFWSWHLARIKSWSPQYQSKVFCHDYTQLELATQIKSQMEKDMNTTFYTDIAILNQFHIAEDYHQKHYLQRYPVLLKDFERYFKFFSDFIDSPSAAKVNGFASGFGNRCDLLSLQDQLGISEISIKKLMEISI